MFCRSLFVVFCLALYCLSIYGFWLSILYLQSFRGKRKCLNTHINSQLLQVFATERFLQIRKLGRTGSPINPCFIIIFLMQNNDLKTCKIIGRHFKLLNIRTRLAHRRSWYGIITPCFTLCFTYLLSLPNNVWRLIVFAPFLIIIIIIIIHLFFLKLVRVHVHATLYWQHVDPIYTLIIQVLKCIYGKEYGHWIIRQTCLIRMQTQYFYKKNTVPFLHPIGK